MDLVRATQLGCNVDVSGLEHKWSHTVEDYPPCAVCGKPIGAEEHTEECEARGRVPVCEEGGDLDCTCRADDVPLLLFRGQGRAMRWLALHFECAKPRMRGG